MENNTHEHHLSSQTWRKSTYSAGDGGDCLEVAEGHPTLVPVRDSKNLGPVIAFGASAWAVFVGHVGAEG
ncbi:MULTISPECIES: DUF397 domain-containing protein [unclassified Streptomyces]|uniref:DUF397 domain-containing protein n=1 Tax=unclassified Streptomyces TaxID=2593676 RepID=UPI0013B7D94D|nr:DUF397 domain-containing protein [Streptomyces sp. SID14446]NEB31122.1 DUF397 domain-containing protein [Streptomyces sp. SID14446]